MCVSYFGFLCWDFAWDLEEGDSVTDRGRTHCCVGWKSSFQKKKKDIILRVYCIFFPLNSWIVIHSEGKAMKIYNRSMNLYL